MTILSGTARRLDSGESRDPQDPVSTRQRATRHQGIGRPLVGILLAAGKSERFGSNKLLHALPDGQPMNAPPQILQNAYALTKGGESDVIDAGLPSV